MTEVTEEVLLGPAELVFLLDDLLRKQEFSLAAGPAKRAPFLKVQSKKCLRLHCVCFNETKLNDALPLFPQGRSDKSVGFSHLQQRSSKDVASYCVQLLPVLCSHLENCHNHFQVQTQQAAFHSSHFFRLSINHVPPFVCWSDFLQTLLSDNNGVVDGPATDAQEHQLMSSGYQLLLQVLNATLSW